MESYVEVTFITNCLVCVFAFYASAYFSFTKKQYKYFMILLFFEQTFHIACLYMLPAVFFYIYEIGMIFYIFNKNIKRGIMYYAIKYVVLCTYFKFLGGSFSLFHYYVNDSTNMVGIWLLMGMLIILLKQKWNHYLQISDFIYSVYFYTEHSFQLKGYLDTGNMLLYNNRPILFVDSRYRNKFISLPYAETDIVTITGNQKHRVYLCEVHIIDYKKDFYYICCDTPILMEFNCKCLLNIEN